MQAVKARMRLYGCVGLSEHLVFINVISTKILHASIYNKQS